MTVKELIKELKTLNQNAEVILSADAEGNDYSPISLVVAGRYEKHTKYSGDFLCAEGNSAVALYPCR